MVTKTLFKKRQCTIKVGATIASPATTSTLYDQITDIVTGGITAWVEEATITFPENTPEMQTELGETSNWQNADFVDQEWQPAKMSVTCTFSPVDTDKTPTALFASGSGTTITSGEKRYQYGSSAAANLRAARAVGFEHTDGTNIIDTSMNNSYWNARDVTLDGNKYRVVLEGTCLPKDFYDEVNA